MCSPSTLVSEGGLTLDMEYLVVEEANTKEPLEHECTPKCSIESRQAP